MCIYFKACYTKHNAELNVWGDLTMMSSHILSRRAALTLFNTLSAQHNNISLPFQYNSHTLYAHSTIYCSSQRYEWVGATHILTYSHTHIPTYSALLLIHKYIFPTNVVPFKG